MIAPRIDLVLGASRQIYLWQSAAFEHMTPELRKRAYELALEKLQTTLQLYAQVEADGGAETDETAA